MPYFDGLAKALRLLRKQRDLTQEEWAKASRVSLGSVNRYERGRLPELEPLGKLLDGAGADLHDLQDALDLANGRESVPRAARPIDAKALARLRLTHPQAPKDLLDARAAVEAELHDALRRADKLDLLIAATAENLDDAGDVAGDEDYDKKLRELLGLRLKRRHPDWTPEHLAAEVERRIQAEAERDARQPREG